MSLPDLYFGNATRDKVESLGDKKEKEMEERDNEG